MKEYNKNDQIVRFALCQAYGCRDFYDERELIFYDSLEIDHLIPYQMADTPEKLKNLIIEYYIRL